jgi:protease YdgD
MRKRAINLSACAALLASFVMANPAAAETFKTRPNYGVIGEDNRKVITDSEAAWTAVGHVNVTGYHSSEQCTGTRIAPGLVLTAAHCVVDHVKKKTFPAQSIHFVAGVDRDKSVGHGVADCVLFPDGFDMNAESRALPDMGVELASREALLHDLALIVLKTDTDKAGVIAIAPQTLQAGQSLFHVGYHRDRRQKLMGDRSCKVVDSAGDLISTDCDAVAGSSGGPVLVQENGAWRIAAVMVANSDRATFAVALTAWPEMMEKTRCR